MKSMSTTRNSNLSSLNNSKYKTVRFTQSNFYVNKEPLLTLNTEPSKRNISSSYRSTQQNSNRKV